MPGFDGTGPLGKGPMTGRGMGYCAVRLPVYGRFPLPYGYAGIAGVPINSTFPVAYIPNAVPLQIMPFLRSHRFGRGFRMGRGRRRWFSGYRYY